MLSTFAPASIECAAADSFLFCSLAAQVLYALCANSDHRTSFHFFPEDMLSALQGPFDRVWYDPAARKFWNLDWKRATDFDASEEGEYVVYVRRN